MTNRPFGVLYIGMTNGLLKRGAQHKEKNNPSFTAKYNLDKLVYYEIFSSAAAAIAREKQLKNWHRQWKINLISQVNPEWRDLYPELLKECFG